ncbi:zinc-binding protein [Suicoccus acidiformans]|uniref:Zinc-binding protein n=1 Tax=Suicoccus acidiformans TaxID=2036206 RepID=A0A347WN20_9LACT|nr:ZinT/AdcA family metal-binding protein [Suicoccus acidiformans]AXY26477.1 zinc-binding protein [Suicoccus acidiformans]
MKKLLLTLSATLLVSAPLVTSNVYADEHDHDHSHEAAPSTDVQLIDWEGEWNSYGAYLEEADVKEALAKAAEKEGQDEAEYTDAIKERRKADFDGLIIDDKTITFLQTRADSDEVKESSKGTYTYSETISVDHGGQPMFWYVFEGDEDAPYPYVLLMDLHGEDTMAHFHMRYGDDLKALADEDSEWYPTFVASDTSTDQVVFDILGE